MTRKELQIKYPDKQFGVINVQRGYDYPPSGIIDQWGNEKKDYSEFAQMIDKGWEFFLDHSCDEWVIGKIKDAEKFAQNLSEAIIYCKNYPY